MNQSNQNPKDNQQFSAKQEPHPTGIPPRQGGQPSRQPMGQYPRQGGQPSRQPMGQPPRQGGQPPRQPMGQPPRQGGQPPRQPMGQPSRQGGQPPRQPMGQPPHQGGQPPRQPMGQVPRQNGQPAHQSISHSTAQQHPQTPNENPEGIPPFLTTKKGIVIALSGALILGLFMGLIMGGGESSQPKTQCSGFEKLVIKNRDIVDRKIPLCGRTDKGRDCILYIMNTSRIDKQADSFFQQAADLTGLQKYSITMQNPQYAKQRIPGGRFVEIKIPGMK